jgi:glycosyltransferase involved in cell wall biosynthesis
LGIPTVDVVICTRNRSCKLASAVTQAKLFFPINQVIIVESSPNPDIKLLNSLQVKTVFTPNVPLGFARQEGLLAANTDNVVFLDDDIIIEPQWYYKMNMALQGNSKAFAASSKVVFGYGCDKTLTKLHTCSLRGEGASIGVAVIHRKLALDIGGFNRKVHRGEDTEFELRAGSKGYKWIRVSSALAYHPLTFKEYIDKAEVNANSWLMLWRNMKSKLRLKFLAYRYGSALLMPFYYGMLSRDPRVFGYDALYKWKMIVTFLWRINAVGS